MHLEAKSGEGLSAASLSNCNSLYLITIYILTYFSPLATPPPPAPASTSDDTHAVKLIATKPSKNIPLVGETWTYSLSKKHPSENVIILEHLPHDASKHDGFLVWKLSNLSVIKVETNKLHERTLAAAQLDQNLIDALETYKHAHIYPKQMSEPIK